MIRNDGPNIDGQLSDAVTIKQVIETMIRLGHHDHYRHPRAWSRKFESHVKRSGTLGKAGLKGIGSEVFGLGPKLGPNEEAATEPIIKGVLLSDVATALFQKARYHVNSTQSARALSSQNPVICTVTHGQPPSINSPVSDPRRCSAICNFPITPLNIRTCETAVSCRTVHPVARSDRVCRASNVPAPRRSWPRAASWSICSNPTPTVSQPSN